MDQIKIGRFIAARRKSKGYTQIQLAEKLNITDRAVSKWETGKSMPDSAIMPELCRLLDITINDLFNGEVIIMENYKEKTEMLLMEITKQKEEADKKLLSLEILIGVFSGIILIGATLSSCFLPIPDWARVCLIVFAFIMFLIGIAFAIRIEQTAGYYECAECGNKYIPSTKSMWLSPHMGRTRRMKCPKCGKVSWQKKVLR